MKSIVLFTVLLIAANCGFAQQAKSTATGDTLTLSNISNTDTVRMLYPSPAGGYTAGTNSYNDKAFAERYDFNHNDTSVNVIGVFACFGGHVNPSSTKSVTFKVWRQSYRSPVGPHLYFLGFPQDLLDSVVVPVTQLGVGTLKKFMFPYPTDFITGGFFVGYSIDYDYLGLAGDTIGLTSSIKGHRTTPHYNVKYTIGTGGDTTAADTFIVVQNATRWADGLWRDNYTQNDSLNNDLAIFPIVLIGHANEVKGITHNQLTLFGAFPNPADDNTNIRFTLQNATDVTISVTDMSGRTVLSGQPMQLSSGEHTSPVNTSSLPAGDYLYIITTSAGDGMAGKMSVSR